MAVRDGGDGGGNGVASGKGGDTEARSSQRWSRSESGSSEKRSASSAWRRCEEGTRAAAVPDSARPPQARVPPRPRRIGTASAKDNGKSSETLQFSSSPQSAAREHGKGGAGHQARRAIYTALAKAELKKQRCKSSRRPPQVQMDTTAKAALSEAQWATLKLARRDSPDDTKTKAAAQG